MKNLLAIEASGQQCSTALFHKGLWSTHSHDNERVQSDYILEHIASLLSEQSLSVADIDAIIVGTGPGSFTGLRVAIAVAQGLASAQDIAVHGIPTLHGLAYQALNQPLCKNTDDDKPQKLLAMLDARMNQVYWQGFECTKHQIKAITSLNLDDPQAIKIINDYPHTTGDGFTQYKDSLSVSDDTYYYDLRSHAQSVGELWLAIQNQSIKVDDLAQYSDELIVPDYVRNDVAHKAKPKA